MSAERLYYIDPFLRHFNAEVTGCTRTEEGWEVTLDRSAFYPEGGGQPGDRGSLGGAAVLDTWEKDGDIAHICASPLEPGARVEGRIDWERRFDHMQQHSGEHIVSGLICARFGCDNVGFHLGADTVVIDFNAPIDPRELAGIELEANRVIWENRPFVISHPSPAELEALSYRSKKELSGDVRIVECPGADICACCGTHVAAAGQIGLIRLCGTKPFRQGVRIELLCGRRAYERQRLETEQNGKISRLLSAPPEATAVAVERRLEELDAASYRIVGLENRVFAAIAEEYRGRGDALLFEDGLEPQALRRLADAVAKNCGGRCAAFSGADGSGYGYAMCSPGCDLRGLTAAMNTALRGRGGGREGLSQGSVEASRAEIEAFFDALRANSL